MKVPPKVSKGNPWDVDCQAAGDGLTDQTAAPDCDINVILSRFALTGQAPVAPPPTYADLTGLRSYKESLDVVRAADDIFASFDASVREKFANDVSLFLDWVQDPTNLSTAQRLGLVAPPASPVSPAPPDPRGPALPISPSQVPPSSI